MTSTTVDTNAGAWYPRLLGVLSGVLGLLALADLLLVPVGNAEQVIFGYVFKGTAAQAATVVHVVFFAFVTWGCLARKRFMVWFVVGYLVYLAITLWIWTSLYGVRGGGFPTATILINTMITVILLALCRVTLGRRGAFNA